jgi:IS6 family transposase
VNRGDGMTDPFKWRHYESEIILTCVRWYLRYALSYRDPEELMTERGLSVDHSTIFRWVQRYAPELDERSRPHLKQTNDSWRVDETYVKVRGKWMYLYRAVDSTGQTLDFLLNETRSTRAAKRFFRKVLGRSNITAPRVINVDKNPAYIGAVLDLKQEKLLPEQMPAPPKPVHEQHCRTGSPFFETEDQTRTWFRIISNRLANDSGLRNDAYDTEGPDRRNRKGQYS